MPAFHEVHPFVVHPEKASTGLPNQWNLLSSGGVRLAVMRHRPDPLLVRGLRALRLPLIFPTTIEIEGLQGEPLFRLEKPLAFGRFLARAFDGQGRPLGRIRERKQGLEGRQYLLEDPSGLQVGSLEGDWRSYSLQLRDGKGSVLGKIRRKGEELNRVIFTEYAACHSVHLYVPQPDPAFRLFLLGTSAAIALLLR